MSAAPGAAGASPDVVLSRIVSSMIPPVVRGIGTGCDAAVVDGWQVMRFDGHGLSVAGEGWLPGDLPVVQLVRDGDVRTVRIVTKVLGTAPLVLRHADDREAVEATARLLAATKHFFDIDPVALAAALQSPSDAGWSARVLTALGLPTVAADVHEGRGALPDATRYAPLGLWEMTVDGVRRHYDPDEAEIRRRRPYGRAYARVTATPARTAALVAVELLLLAVVLWGFAEVSGVPRWILGLLALTLAGEVVWHCLMGPGKFRRRRELQRRS